MEIHNSNLHIVCICTHAYSSDQWKSILLLVHAMESFLQIYIIMHTCRLVVLVSVAQRQCDLCQTFFSRFSNDEKKLSVKEKTDAFSINMYSIILYYTQVLLITTVKACLKMLWTCYWYKTRHALQNTRTKIHILTPCTYHYVL